MEKKEDKVLLLSRYALDCQPYNKDSGETTWEACTLRKWMNDDFYKAAFSSTEQKVILRTKVENNDNPSFETAGGAQTEDNVFLLSLADIEAYYDFGPDQWINANGAPEPNLAPWWLRSPGASSEFAACIIVDGSVYPYGDNVRSGMPGVRPAIWVKI